MAPKYSNKLEGKRILVIGGTSGIGFCVAEACVEFGAIVTVASSSQQKVDKTIQRLSSSYPDAKTRISGQTIDLASSDVEKALNILFEFTAKDGRLDHVVHTAGDKFTLKTLSEITPEAVQKHGNIRYISALIMAKVALKYMHQTSQSSITLSGGVANLRPPSGWSTPAGWAAATEGLARALAVELNPIRVNLIAPGSVDTEMFDDLSGGDPAKRKQLIDLFGSKTLLGKCGSPEDVAEAYLYMMRDTFVTGHILVSDGGYLLS
jgi:NAD(P)-dependent dehydrogenase (short-subunit alcohol dehydrogenase family)